MWFCAQFYLGHSATCLKQQKTFYFVSFVLLPHRSLSWAKTDARAEVRQRPKSSKQFSEKIWWEGTLFDETVDEIQTQICQHSTLVCQPEEGLEWPAVASCGQCGSPWFCCHKSQVVKWWGMFSGSFVHVQTTSLPLESLSRCWGCLVWWRRREKSVKSEISSTSFSPIICFCQLVPIFHSCLSTFGVQNYLLLQKCLSEL